MITVPNKLHVYHHLFKLSLFHMLKSYINTNMLIISKMYIIDKYSVLCNAILHVWNTKVRKAYTIYIQLLLYTCKGH